MNSKYVPRKIQSIRFNCIKILIAPRETSFSLQFDGNLSIYLHVIENIYLYILFPQLRSVTITVIPFLSNRYRFRKKKKKKEKKQRKKKGRRERGNEKKHIVSTISSKFHFSQHGYICLQNILDTEVRDIMFIPYIHFANAFHTCVTRLSIIIPPTIYIPSF